MKAAIAVIADCANVESQGKLNIMGIFDVINSPQVPARHPEMHLVVQLIPSPTELSVPIPLEVQLVDQDGRTIFGLRGQAMQQSPTGGEQTTTNVILVLKDVVFERFGDYEFKILAWDEPVASIPLKVRHVTAASPSAQ